MQKRTCPEKEPHEKKSKPKKKESHAKKNKPKKKETPAKRTRLPEKAGPFRITVRMGPQRYSHSA